MTRARAAVAPPPPRPSASNALFPLTARRRTASLALLALAGCEEDFEYEGAFDMPVAAAVLQPETGGPFQQPVAFVANGLGGNIVPLDLKYGRFLTTDPTASFLRTAWLPTGEARLLSDVAVYAPDPGEVSLFAGDRAFDTLLFVPFVVGIDDRGFPIEGWLEDGEVRTEPVVGEIRTIVSGNAAIRDVEIKDGYTSTETWTVAWEPVRRDWLVTGSRSGLQEDAAIAGERFVGDRRRIAFTIEGQGEEGDRFEIDTDNGVREIDVGGTPTELAMSPDQTVLVMTVDTREDDDGAVVRFFDPATEAVTLDVALAADSEPGRLAWAPDGATIFAADSSRPAVWEIALDGTAIEHVLPFPTIDLAPLYSLEFGRLLYVVPLDGHDVWIYDLDARAFVDVNASVVGVQPMPFESPVLGIEAIGVEHLFREEDDQGVRRSGRSVAVSLHEGKVVFMEEGTGCLLEDPFGPRTTIESTLGISDIVTTFDDVVGAPFVQQNSTNDRHVIVNGCGGIARDESWTLRFDRNVAAWRVEAVVSGEQESLAFEDERYLSDDGEVSFVVRAGSTPSQEGWEIEFTVDDGVLEATGDNDGDGTREVEMDVPGDPVFFHYTAGPVEGAWAEVRDLAFVLVPAQGADIVGRVDPQEGDVEVRWD